MVMPKNLWFGFSLAHNTKLDLSKQLANALGNYEKIWDDCYDTVEKNLTGDKVG